MYFKRGCWMVVWLIVGQMKQPFRGNRPVPLTVCIQNVFNIVSTLLELTGRCLEWVIW